jgi:hypothetical protein
MATPKQEMDKLLAEMKKAKFTLDRAPVPPWESAIRRADTHISDASIYGIGVSRQELEEVYPSQAINVSRPEREKFPAWTPYDKLKMRLNMEPAAKFGKDVHCNIFTGPNLVFVFVCKGDKALILEDDVNLFPSDSLVGQFRLFLESVQ